MILMKKYFVDTSIWLNLFNREGDSTKGIPYWKLAQTFIENTLFNNDSIYYSGSVLRELQLRLSVQEYAWAYNFIINLSNTIKLETLQIDKDLARKLESKYSFTISFYDLIHLNISKRLNMILVTRDNELIGIARENGVIAKKPEQL